jgi:hypothetical protein
MTKKSYKIKYLILVLLVLFLPIIILITHCSNIVMGSDVKKVFDDQGVISLLKSAENNDEKKKRSY